MNEPLRDLLARVEAATDEMSIHDRRPLEGEIHRALTGLPTCEERYGVRNRCVHAWPAECRSENDPWAPHTYYCGVGRIGGLHQGRFIPHAPGYVETAASRAETIALLRALIAQADGEAA